MQQNVLLHFWVIIQGHQSPDNLIKMRLKQENCNVFSVYSFGRVTVKIVHKLSQKATNLQGYRCHLTEKDCNEIIEFEQNNRSIQNHFTLFQVCMNMCPEKMVKRVCDQLLTLRIAFIVKLVTLKTIARISIGCALRAVVDQLTTECKPDLLNIYERLNKFAQSD